MRYHFPMAVMAVLLNSACGDQARKVDEPFLKNDATRTEVGAEVQYSTELSADTDESMLEDADFDGDDADDFGPVEASVPAQRADAEIDIGNEPEWWERPWDPTAPVTEDMYRPRLAGNHVKASEIDACVEPFVSQGNVALLINSGTPYEAFRDRFLDAGYVADTETDEYHACASEDARGSITSKIMCPNAPETVYCLTTGNGGCVFGWIKGGHRLRVVTIGENSTGGAIAEIRCAETE